MKCFVPASENRVEVGCGVVIVTRTEAHFEGGAPEVTVEPGETVRIPAPVIPPTDWEKAVAKWSAEGGKLGTVYW
jgi:hypothetical protein